jgi:flagellar protein FliS
MSAYSHSSSLAAYQSVAAHGKVDAADPHRLIVMLMDGALERIAAARGAMANGAQGHKARLIHRTVSIIDELRACLNYEARQIAANMADIYDYCRQPMRVIMRIARNCWTRSATAGGDPALVAIEPVAARGLQAAPAAEPGNGLRRRWIKLP